MIQTSKITEWKRIPLSEERLDFSGASNASLEISGDDFLALTFKLRCGRTVRIRKNDYSVRIEEPIIPVQVKYLAKTEHGLEKLFDDKESAESSLVGVEGTVEEVKTPIEVQG